MKKNALITGASRGIGEAIARKLALEGYNLILVCHNNIEKMTALADELKAAYSVSVDCYNGDIGDSSFVRQIFKDMTSLDVLVNNAGIAYIGLLQDMTDDDWRKVMATNLDSVFYTSREAIKLMLPKKSGRIINISSMWGTVGASMEVAYSASKGGMNTFTKALAKELAPSGIAVNAITCGVIETDMNKCFSDEENQAIKDEIPIGRFADPSEVAEVVATLVTTTPYVTGQIIGLDGGYI